MGAEEHDIVARVGRSGATTSTGALAAHLAGSCGHVMVDARVIRQGYRFHAELGDEIPAFFNKRVSTGSTNVAITLQSGVDVDAEAALATPFTSHDRRFSEDPFGACRSTADARLLIEAEDYHASLWIARVTVGVELLEVADVARPLFIAKHPNEFRVVAEELVAVGLLQGAGCPMCADEASTR